MLIMLIDAPLSVHFVLKKTSISRALDEWEVFLDNVNRKEIDSQGELIETATNTAFFIVVSYQVCMMAFFSIKQLQAEANKVGSGKRDGDGDDEVEGLGGQDSEEGLRERMAELSPETPMVIEARI